MGGADHILSYAQTLGGGGVERALLRLARGWLAEGRRVTLAIGDVRGPLAAEAPAGMAIVPLGRGDYRGMLALPEVVRAESPDVIFCAGSHYTGIAAWTRIRLGRACPPIVAKVSNAPERGDHGAVTAALHRAWLRRHPRFLDAIVAMTPASADAVARATGVARGRIAVIPNPPARAIRGAAAVALPAGRFVLGVGRLAPQKRWDRLIAALPRLSDRSVALVIAGEGALRGALTARAARLGVAHRVLLPGHAADPFPAMAAAAVLALTSDYEGVPGVLREALSVGTPVVTTDSSASIAEIVSARELGTIVARGDTDALVAALEAWLAPGAVRPAPVTPPGAVAAARYLALFDGLVDGSSARRRS